MIAKTLDVTPRAALRVVEELYLREMRGGFERGGAVAGTLWSARKGVKCAQLETWLRPFAASKSDLQSALAYAHRGFPSVMRAVRYALCQFNFDPL